jgi:protein SCO1/2
VPDRDWLRTAVASIAICATAGGLGWYGTDGYRAFTSEQARRTAVARHPRTLPAVALEDQNGRAFSLGAYRGRPVVVDFVYTQCTSACPLLSAGFQRLYRKERSRDATQPLQLVTISFDARDDPDHLRAYAEHYRADGTAWRFARVRDARQLASLLDAFGVVVIPNGRGDFQHNAADHVVDAQGRLTRVLDAAADPDAVAKAVGNTRQ